MVEGPRRLLFSCALLFPATLGTAVPAFAQTYQQLIAQAPAKKHGPGVRALFDAATRLYEAGKYPEALNAYLALLHRFPGHVPAMIQTAKTLYRMDRYKDAAAYFGRVNLLELDAETSYEYGWTFFSLKSYEPALKAFQRVPSGHSLFDLANYYGGIAAIKLKRYDVAEDMLDKAVVLPDKLAKSRALYVKHVQALRLLHQRSELAKERELERETLAMEVPKKKPKTEDVPNAAVEAATPYQGFQTVEKSSNLAFLADQQASSNQNVAHSSYNANIGSLDVRTGPLFLLPVRQGTRQGATGAQLDVGAEDRSATGSEQTIWALASDYDLTRQFNQQLGNNAATGGKAGVDLWVELPVPGNLWVALGGEANLRYGSFQESQRTGYYRGYLNLRGRYSWGTVSAQAVYHSLLDPSGQPIVEIGGGNAGFEAEVISKLLVGLSGNFENLHYENNGSGLDGPDTVSGVQLTITQVLPFGFKIQAFGAYEQESNYLFHHVPSYAVVGADGANYVGKASLEANPWPFIVFGLSAAISTTTWTLHDPSSSPSFDLSVPNNTQDINAWAGLNLVF